MEIKKGTFYVLPSASNCCQVCGQIHPDTEPHDPTALKYQMLFAANHPQGKSPTWEDAMAHCEEDVKTKWRRTLKTVGIDSNSSDVRGEINTQEELDKRLKNDRQKTLPDRNRRLHPQRSKHLSELLYLLRLD